MALEQRNSRKPLPQPPGFNDCLDQTSKTASTLDGMAQAESKLPSQNGPHSRQQERENNGEATRPSFPTRDIDETLECADTQVIELQMKLDDATAALASLHSTDQFRLGDDRIARLRDELRHDIRQWSRKFHQPHKKSAFSKVLKEANIVAETCPFESISPYYLEYLAEDNEKGPSMLVQSYVWKNLLADVFCQWTWMGGPCRGGGAKYCRLYESAKDLDSAAYEANKSQSLIKNYHHWRAQTARVIGNSPKRHQDCINRKIDVITRKMKSDLKNYTEEKHIFGDHENNKGTNNLAAIVRAAVAFDLLLFQQKAGFDFTEISPEIGGKFQFTSEWMAGDNNSEGEEQNLMRKGITAKLFCAPALYKYGTSEGENYGESLLICKAVVDCLV